MKQKTLFSVLVVFGGSTVSFLNIKISTLYFYEEKIDRKISMSIIHLSKIQYMSLLTKSVSFRMCVVDDSEIIYPKLTCILCTTITYLFSLSFSVVLFVHCRVSSSCFVGSYTYIPEIAGGILSGGLPIVVSAVLIPRMGVFLETPSEYFTCC